MRVLHINCNYIGTPLHQLMVEELEKQGIINEVFVPTYNKKLSVIDVNDNVCVSECFNKVDRISYYYKQKKILKNIEKNFDITQFDLIHAYTLFTDGNIAMELSNKYNIPYVVAIRNTDVNDFFRYRPYLMSRGLKILKHSKKVFFLSYSYKRLVEEKYAMKNEKGLFNKFEVIPNGIDDFWFDNKTIKKNIKLIENRLKFEKKVKLIFVGKINQNKNINTIINAVDLLELQDYKISLTVIGKIEDRKEYNKIVNHKFVTYIKPQSKENLIKYYRENDIFVMTSIFESFGLVYAEALTQGLPIIYSKNQGFDGWYSQGEVGYAVDSLSCEELAKAIVSICNNYSFISENCVKGVDRFRWERIVNKYKNIYFSKH